MKLLFVGLCCLALVSCSKSERSAPNGEAAKAVPAHQVATTQSSPQKSFDEPSEKVLRDFVLAEYAEIEASGGMPVTLSATGASGILRTKVHSVKKDRCEQPKHGVYGKLECGVNLTLSTSLNGQAISKGKPTESASRVTVIQDAKGKWIHCNHLQHRDPKSICRTGR